MGGGAAEVEGERDGEGERGAEGSVWTRSGVCVLSSR